MTGLFLFDNFLSTYCLKPGKILDVGGTGSIVEAVVKKMGHAYERLNLGSGEYDVKDDPYNWTMIPDKTYDYVISLTAFEHVEFPWLTFLEMIRVVKDDGLIYIIAPSQGGLHPHELDCWRIFPDGMRALAKWGKVKLVQTSIDSTSGGWQYCEGLFTK